MTSTVIKTTMLKRKTKFNTTLIRKTMTTITKLTRGRLEIPYLIQRARLLYLLSQYATSIQVSSDCYSFMTGIYQATTVS